MNTQSFLKSVLDVKVHIGLRRKFFSLRKRGRDMGNSSFITRNMNEQGNNEYRREQVRVARILRDQLGNSKVRQEYHVYGLKIDGDRASDAFLDVAIPKEKIAIRMMGGIHLSSGKQRMKDWYQEEALKQAGWKVFDFFEDKFPNIWKKKRSYDVDMASKKEVLDKLGMVDKIG